MHITHPDGKRIIVMLDGIGMVGEIEIGKPDEGFPGWVIIGYVGQSGGGTLVDKYEWAAFVALVDEIDGLVRSNV